MSVVIYNDKSFFLNSGHIVCPTDTIVIEACKQIVGLISAILIKDIHYAVNRMLTGYHYAIYEIICIIAPTVCKFVFGIVFSVNIFPNFDIHAVFGIADIACRYFTVKPAEISKSNFICTLCA